MAQSNQDIYSRLSVAYHSIYNQPYRLIMSEKQKNRANMENHQVAKQKIKVPNEVINEVHDYAKAA